MHLHIFLYLKAFYIFRHKNATRKKKLRKIYFIKKVFSLKYFDITGPNALFISESPPKAQLFFISSKEDFSRLTEVTAKD